MAREYKPPSSRELKSRIDNLQAEVTHFIAVKQELIDTQGLVDRERNRFKGIQACIRELLRVEDMETFATILTESILATFEFEVSLFTTYDSQRRHLDVVAQAGFEVAPTSLPFDIDWLEGNTGVILPSGHDVLGKWASAGLGEAIICPYFSENDHPFAGLVIGGLTIEGRDHFEPVTAEVISSFSVLVAQVGSLLRNRELERKLQAQNLRLELYSKNLGSIIAEQTQEQRSGS